MLALLEKKTYQDTKALDAAVNQIFMVQTAMATLTLLYSLFTLSLHLHHVVTVAMTTAGFLLTKTYNPESWKYLTAPTLYIFFNGVTDFFGFFISLNFSLSGLVATLVKFGLCLVQCYGMVMLWRTLQTEAIYGNYFYLNIVVLNKDQVMETKIQEKCGKRPFGKLVSKLVNTAVSDQKFCRKMMTQMEKEIPEKMKLKGLTATAKALFSKHNYFVLKITVTGVDVALMIKSKDEDGSQGGLEKSEKVRQVLDKLPGFIKEEVNYLLNLVIAGGMVKNMPKQLTEEMKTKAGMDVEAVGKSASDQADFFFELMSTLAPVAVSSDDGPSHQRDPGSASEGELPGEANTPGHAEEGESSPSRREKLNDKAHEAAGKAKAKVTGLFNKLKHGHSED